MKYSRSFLSLNGVHSLLTAVGGWNGDCELRKCEIFYAKINNWRELPPLGSARMRPGSILLKSMKMLCFCGQEEYEYSNSIESIELAHSGEWKPLFINHQVAKTFDLAAI